MEGREGYLGGIEDDSPMKWYRLRHYHNDPNLGFHFLRYFLGLANENDKKAVAKVMPAENQEDYRQSVLVAIDIEGKVNKAREIGITTLDLRILSQATTSTEASASLKSYNFKFQTEKNATLGKVPMFNFRAS